MHPHHICYDAAAIILPFETELRFQFQSNNKGIGLGVLFFYTQRRETVAPRLSI